MKKYMERTAENICQMCWHTQGTCHSGGTLGVLKGFTVKPKVTEEGIVY